MAGVTVPVKLANILSVPVDTGIPAPQQRRFPQTRENENS